MWKIKSRKQELREHIQKTTLSDSHVQAQILPISAWQMGSAGQQDLFFESKFPILIQIKEEKYVSNIRDSRKKIRIFEYYSVFKILESESEYSRFEEKDSNLNRIRIYSIISDTKVTCSDPKVTHSDPIHFPLPPPTSPVNCQAIS